MRCKDMRMSIYELLTFCEIDKVNVVDNESGYTATIECVKDKSLCKTWFEKCIRYICIQVEVSNYLPNSKSTAYITEFIKKNINTFNEFLNEVAFTGFRPKDIDRDIEGEEFKLIYLDSMFYWIIKNKFTDDQYHKLFKLLSKQ